MAIITKICERNFYRVETVVRLVDDHIRPFKNIPWRRFRVIVHSLGPGVRAQLATFTALESSKGMLDIRE